MANCEKSFANFPQCRVICELQAEKVLFLNELRAEPNPQQRAAQMAQFGGNARETEAALLKSGRFFRAIMLNLGIFRFDRLPLPSIHKL